jgi:hypothetical protein
VQRVRGCAPRASQRGGRQGAREAYGRDHRGRQRASRGCSRALRARHAAVPSVMAEGAVPMHDPTDRRIDRLYPPLTSTRARPSAPVAGERSTPDPSGGTPSGSREGRRPRRRDCSLQAIARAEAMRGKRGKADRRAHALLCKSWARRLGRGCSSFIRVVSWWTCRALAGRVSGSSLLPLLEL